MNDKPEERELSLNEIRQIMDSNPEGELKLSEDDMCDHQYRESLIAPLGVTCTKCGHFVGAWE